MRTVKITVAGQTFHIKSDASEDRLAELATEVEARFLKLKKGSTRGDQDFIIMSMVAISLLDELSRALERYETVSEMTRRFASGLIVKIDELLMRDME
jgi:cell division protein ZapA (FtsZ GTPase activity inhibitor)